MINRRMFDRCTYTKLIVIVVASIAGMPGDAFAALRNRYSFNNSPGVAFDGALIQDLIGTSDGFVRGADGTFTGSQLTLPGGQQATGGAYVDLPNGLASSLTNATFEAWYTINSATSWPRVFDFGSMRVGSFTNPIPAEITGPGVVPFGQDAGDTFF